MNRVTAEVVEDAKVQLAEQFKELELASSGGSKPGRYRLLQPRPTTPGKRYPALLYLHGAGERGDDNRAQLKYLPEQMASSPWREKYPCLLIAPQCPADDKWTDVDWSSREPLPMGALTRAMQMVVAVLEDVVRRCPIDLQRVYLTGLSMGGYGCWELALRAHTLCGHCARLRRRR